MKEITRGNEERDQGLRKGPWTREEDVVLAEYVKKHGEGNWNAVQHHTKLPRCGKSCRLRWSNHLRPNLKKCPFTLDEENLIILLHARFGNKWARMATQVCIFIFIFIYIYLIFNVKTIIYIYCVACFW